MAITIQHKRDTAANWTSNNPTLASGEFGFETDTGKFKIGDGSTAWSSLGYFETAAPSGPSYSFQGSTSGYTSGGYVSPNQNVIDKWPFSSDGNATDVGDLTNFKDGLAGNSSSDNGYNSGGWEPAAPGYVNVIEKFPFSTDTNSTDVGDLTSVKYFAAGQSMADNGYISGGFDGTARTNVIEKFPFSADSNASDVGDLTVTRNTMAGQSSSDNGYTSAGFDGSARTNVIDKYPFSSDGNATDVGDLTDARNSVTGQSSTTHGYTTTGYSGSASNYVNIIDKFAFASDGNASDVGDMLTNFVTPNGGQSSTTNGYAGGGLSLPAATPPNQSNIIAKFPFSTDSNATDVGDLTLGRYGSAGQQV